MPHLPITAIRAAHSLLAGRVMATPLVPLGTARVLLKAECLQPAGSFKIRGATVRLAQLTAAERRAGVVAYSTGNHAQAVARAAADADVPATIVMSPDAPAAKVEATRGLGATVVMAAPSSAARRALAEQLARERGLALVPPYDDLAVMAGQGTIGLEILDQMAASPPAAVYVPVGGGGLLAGIAAAIKQVAPAVRVIGVEPVLEDDACRAFRSRQPVRLPGPSESIADAVKVQELGRLTLPLILAHVDDMVAVPEAAIAAACRACAEAARLVVEPSGALAAAAALAAADTGPIVAIASGGNITLDRLAALRA